MVEDTLLPVALDDLPRDAALGAEAGLRAQHATLSTFFGGRSFVPSKSAEAAGYLGWGSKPSGRIAHAQGQHHKRPFVLIEDGFLRSVGLGKEGAPPVSLVVDDRGVFYDARTPSRLEAILRSNLASPSGKAEEALQLWRSERLSKYNIGLEREIAPQGSLIILIDQVRKDASIAGAGADERVFIRMLNDAVAQFAAQDIAIRVHPDVVAGRARGYLSEIPASRGLRIIAEDICAPAILDTAREIWTVSSQMGFEALLRDIPVVTYAMPFYAGYGLTRDMATGTVADAARARRSAELSIPSLFEACFFTYARYADPVTRRAVPYDGAVARILDWRLRVRANQGLTTACFGFAGWKRRAATAFLGGPSSKVVLAAKKPTLQAYKSHGTEVSRVAIWGAREPDWLINTCQQDQRPLLRVEDGFLRSVGLGSDLRLPGSLVLDDLGMYYDARRMSRLEQILESGSCDAAQIERAKALRQKLLDTGVTKYNLPVASIETMDTNGRPVALVIEQVPGDAALLFGGGDEVNSNVALLHAVRRACPEHFIIYKEHPDLVAGNRRGRRHKADVLKEADRIVSDGDVLGLFTAVDDVHVISSLAGFEALIRGKRVVTWGRPFYGGWGLTQDHVRFERRHRKVSLDELVAATLIAYPSYADPLTGIPCPVEDYLETLLMERRMPTPSPLSPARRQLGRFIRWFDGVFSS